MQNKTIKTYACKNATPNSNNNVANKRKEGKKNKKQSKKESKSKKLQIINTSVCPAIILALKRIAKLKVLIE